MPVHLVSITRKALKCPAARRAASGGNAIARSLLVRLSAALLLLATRGIGVAPGGPFQLGSPGATAGRSGGPHLRVTVGLVASGHREVAAALADAAGAGARPAPPR